MTEEIHSSFGLDEHIIPYVRYSKKKKKKPYVHAKIMLSY